MFFRVHLLHLLMIQFENTLTWEKLSVDLEMLAGDTTNLLQLLIDLNIWLRPEWSSNWVTKSIRFMIYDLQSQCETLTEQDRFHLLKETFFHTKNFQIQESYNEEWPEQSLLICPVFEAKSGHPILISLLYQHLASCLNLNIHRVQLKNQHLLKWISNEKVSYSDLTTKGKTLNEEELLERISKSSLGHKKFDSFHIAPIRKSFIVYVEALMKVYENQPQLHFKLLSIYNILLKVDPQNSYVLSKRAQLCLRLGNEKAAYYDLKRYFSFVDPTNTSTELIEIFNQLSYRIKGEQSHLIPSPEAKYSEH
ncbi:MAG: transglutaminase-like domain-containing protein [Bdellovibrionales bacterium]|nr:transglutaminase-like domain-containing protein [Bdellovibrionales bacterium]